jgi:hypothetical protein
MDASTLPPAWSSRARAWSRLAGTAGVDLEEQLPARTNWLSRSAA